MSQKMREVASNWDAAATVGRSWPRDAGRRGAGLLAGLLAMLLAVPAGAVELDRIRVALLIDAMAARGAGYDPTELNALGVDGLAAVLDDLLPQTAPAPRGRRRRTHRLKRCCGGWRRWTTKTSRRGKRPPPG